MIPGWALGWSIALCTIGSIGVVTLVAGADQDPGRSLFAPPSSGAGSRTVQGNGNGEAAITSERLSFHVGGQGRGLVMPGGADVPVELVFTNPNSAPITITSVETTIGGVSAGGCDPADFVVVQQLAAEPTVPAGATSSLSGLDVPTDRWPQLRMLDSGRQDACRGASVDLHFSATAKS